jgi:hypothetical protein
MEAKEKIAIDLKKSVEKKSNQLELLSAVLVALIVLLFIQFLFKNTVNVPYFDDFSYFDYTLRLLASDDTFSFVKELLSKHNGHGVLTAKLVFWIDYLVEGQINYRHLILASSVLVIFIFTYFIWIFKKNNLPFFYTIPIALLLFSPLYYENLMWAAASWQYIASIAGGLCMYFLLAQQRAWTFFCALFVGFLTTYTNGNGLLGFLLGIAIILPQKNYKKLALWLIGCSLTGLLYYTYSPSGFGTEAGHELVPFSITLVSFMSTVAYFLRLNMNDLIVTGTTISAVFAFALLIYLPQILPVKIAFYSNTRLSRISQVPANTTLFTLTAWSLITGLCVAWTRGMTEFSTVQRYMIYSIIHLIILYTLALLITPRKYRGIIGGIGIIAGLTFQFCAYLYIVPTIINFRNSLWADAYNLKNHRHLSGKIETMNNPISRSIFEESIDKGIYVFPKTPLPSSNSELQALQSAVVDTVTVFSFKKDTLSAYSGILITYIVCNSLILDESDPTNSIYIALKDRSTDQIHLTAANPTQNMNRKSFLMNRNHFNPGVVAPVYEDNVAPGSYLIGILSIKHKEMTLTFTNKEVEIGKVY